MSAISRLSAPCHQHTVDLATRTVRQDGLSEHARSRMSQRAVRAEHVGLALQYGLRIEQDGSTVYYLGRRHVPPFLGPSEAARVEGTTVVVSRDGCVITSYRVRRVVRRLRRRGIPQLHCVGRRKTTSGFGE